MSSFDKIVIPVLMFGFTLSNYLFQTVAGQDWNNAFERSFFQVVALGGYALIKYLLKAE